MDQNDDQDPFIGLQEWAEDTERRVRRERRRGGLRRKALVAVNAAVAVLLVVVTVLVVRPLLSASAGDDVAAAYPTQSVPGGVSATSSASAAPTDPFAGTPAAGYPKGEAGITLPKATAVTGFTAAQVDTALRRVRAALVAARLDRSMLVRHDPATFLALLAPNDRDDVSKWFKSTNRGLVATWIDPAVRLDPAEPPRVSGRVTYSSTRIKGIQTLRVTTNFIWVYAFEGPDRPLAAEHDEIRWEFPSPKNLRAGDQGMWIADTQGYSAWVDCAAAAKGLLAPTRHGTVTAPSPRNSEEADAYLRADHALDIADDCSLKPSASPSK
jgi:hypothetical protein